MKEDAKSVLLRIARDVETQVRFLQAAYSRPEVDRNGASRTALELMLKSIAVNLRKIDDADLARIADQIDALDKTFTDVAAYLGDLKRGWRCRNCSSKVARAASVRGDPADPIVLLVCERCGGETEVTEEGKQIFDRVFGALVGPDWRPALNGFRTDER